MIENGLKRMFPGIQFHMPSLQEARDRAEYSQIIEHWGAEGHYRGASNQLKKDQQFYKGLLDRVKDAPPEDAFASALRDDIQEAVEKAKREKKDLFQDVLSTNRALPKRLQKKHSK